VKSIDELTPNELLRLALDGSRETLRDAVSFGGRPCSEDALDCFLTTIMFLSFHRRSPMAMYRGGHGEWLSFKHIVESRSILPYEMLMTRLKALCSDFSKPELPHSDVHLPTPMPRPTVVTPPIVHRLEYTIAKIGKLFLVPDSTPIGLDEGLVRSQSLKSKLASAKQINNAKKVRARGIY
jgi:hypothetical protein